MNLPHFLIIGTARAGTTALSAFLNAHPDVHIPFKEPNYFSGWISRKQFSGPVPSKPIDPRRACKTLEEYKQLFSRSGQAVVLGEASVSYIVDADAPSLIRETVPAVKLIAILRQPAERAFANFVLYRFHGIEPETDFATCIQQEVSGQRRGWLPYLRYIEVGNYATQLRRYQSLFPPTQLKVFLFEDWREHPQRVWREILEYLDLNNSFSPEFSQTINPSRIENPMWGPLQRMKPIWRLMPLRLRNRMRGRVKSWAWRQAKLNSRLRDELTSRFYIEQIQELQEMIGRDLNHWLPRSSRS